MEGNRSSILEEDWLFDNFANVPGDLVIHASDVVRNIMGNAVYGFMLKFDSTTGQAQEPTEEQKQCIQTLYDRLRNYWDAVGRSNMVPVDEEELARMTPEQREMRQKEQEKKILERMPKMGYFLAVAGDYCTETEHETYTPDMEDDVEEEKDRDEDKQRDEKEGEEVDKEKEEEGGEAEEEEEKERKRRREG